MTPKKWYRLGVGLLTSGIALMVAALFLAYRYLVNLPVPLVFHDWLEQASTSFGRFSGAVILCGPGVIVGLFGYALIEKYHHDV